MRTKWVKGNAGPNEEAIVFFLGWGMPANIFDLNQDEDLDICWVNDYQHNDFTELEEALQEYKKVHLISWSFGVLMAGKFLNQTALKLQSCIALNGVLRPIDDHYGIPKEIFQGTLDYLNERSYQKFLGRTFGGMRSYAAYKEYFQEADIAKLKKELEFFQVQSEQSVEASQQWSHVHLSESDMIIPFESQCNYWNQVKEVEVLKNSGAHFPLLEAHTWRNCLLKLTNNIGDDRDR